MSEFTLIIPLCCPTTLARSLCHTCRHGDWWHADAKGHNTHGQGHARVAFSVIVTGLAALLLTAAFAALGPFLTLIAWVLTLHAIYKGWSQRRFSTSMAQRSMDGATAAK
jgi:uncharacterized membrane protein